MPGVLALIYSGCAYPDDPVRPFCLEPISAPYQDVCYQQVVSGQYSPVYRIPDNSGRGGRM
ncbi:hypothetical protein KDV38_09180 [Providencia rettgeri]